MPFAKAQKFAKKARIALIGPAKSGKSLTSLLIARGLVGAEGRIAAADSEHGSLSLYADRVAFDVQELGDFHPERYMNMIDEAEREGYDALVLDSITHEWNSTNGILHLVDKNGGKGWNGPSQLHTEFVERMHNARVHIIATIRAKMKYEYVANEHGKIVPQKLGIQPVQRDEIEYEFDLVGNIDHEHVLTTGGTRLGDEFNNMRVQNAGVDLGERVRSALTGIERPRKLEPWETVQYLLGELTGTLVCESAPSTIERYMSAVEHHVKRHPEWKKPEADEWRAHYALCRQVKQKIEALETEKQQKGPDSWGMDPGAQS